MFRRLILSISSIVVFELCAAAQAKPPVTPAEPPKQEEEAPPAMAVPPTYKFQVRGRRDPFINPVPKSTEQKQAAVPADRPKGPRGVLLSEAQIAAVVVSKEAPELTRVLVRTTAGRTYSLRKGDALYDAVVKDIRRDAVVFELTSKDIAPNTREVVRKVSP